MLRDEPGRRVLGDHLGRSTPAVSSVLCMPAMRAAPRITKSERPFTSSFVPLNACPFPAPPVDPGTRTEAASSSGSAYHLPHPRPPRRTPQCELDPEVALWTALARAGRPSHLAGDGRSGSQRRGWLSPPLSRFSQPYKRYFTCWLVSINVRVRTRAAARDENLTLNYLTPSCVTRNLAIPHVSSMAKMVQYYLMRARGRRMLTPQVGVYR